VSDRPNVLFVLADQLRAGALPAYGERQIETPHLDRLAAEGVTLTNAISTCPVCTPYRSMLLAGRHPQTTGHVINFLRTRHDEISIADAFAHAGYRTGWIGKWHLHTGSFPQVEGPDYVPRGRDRLGFEYWRGYNFHCQYFGGWVNVGEWRNERWEGYETDALNRYAFEFLDDPHARPFCLFVSPHQPHFTGVSDFAPRQYYARLPERLSLPANVPRPDPGPDEPAWASPVKMYRHYLAMTLALDDMVGELLAWLDRTGLAESTLFVFTSDHGTQGGSHGIRPWHKKMPYEESVRVPLILRLPGVLDGGARRDALTSPVDIFPTLCSLCGVAIPPTVEGRDLSDAWLGREGAHQRDAALMMNFGADYDYLEDGDEWRGLRTKRHTYVRWLDGREELYDLQQDPLQMRNLAGGPAHSQTRARLEGRMRELMAELSDELLPARAYESWFDSQRRIVCNARGPLGHPESPPDFSLLRRPS